MTIRSLTALTLTALLASAAFAQSADPAKTDAKPGETMSDTMKDGAMKDSMAGTFRSLEAPTKGKVTWSKSGENYVLKISGLKTEPAPDLQVWLYQGDVKKGDAKVKTAGKYLTVGTLKKFGGDFSFTVAAKDLGKDMSKFNSVVLWCDQVAAAFAVATLK